LPSAASQGVGKIATFRDGHIGLAINNGGFCSYDGHQFQGIGDDRWSQPGLDALTVIEAPDGAVWTGGSYDLGRWLAGDPAGSFLDTTNFGTVLSLCADAAGRVWIGTAEHGFYFWENGLIKPYPDKTLDHENISALAADSTGTIWAGTATGLFRCSNGVAQRVSGLTPEIKALLVDRHGRLWAGTTAMGLAVMQNGRIEFFQKADGLCSDYVTSLFEDAEGSLWIGTQDGISQLSDLKFPTYSARQGLFEGSAHSVAASKSGGLWIGSDTGLFKFDGHSATNLVAGSPVSNHYVKLCYEARNGDVYAEDGDRGIDVFSSGKFTARFNNADWISAIAEDAQSMLMASGSGDAVYRFQNGQLSHYHYPGAAPDYYWVYNMFVDRSDSVWVASKNGLYRLDRGRVTRWCSTNGLSGNVILCVAQSQDDAIWVGLSTGIARIKGNQARNIKVENGLPDGWIYAIVPDDNGCLWFSSSRGIFRASRRSLDDFADGKSQKIKCDVFDGLESVKSISRTDQENSGCKTMDGRIWFPSPSGVIMVDPAHVPRNDVAPPVHIVGVRADGVEMDPGKSLIIPPGRGQLEVSFSALTFIAPEKAQFRYKLDGFDPDWIDSNTRRQAVYSNLKPGRYVFHVIAANADGVWNSAGDSLSVEFRPHFRQTTWFYLACGALTLACLGAIYAWRVRHLETRQAALQRARDLLETQVASRTAELARANDSLQKEAEQHRLTALQLAKRTEALELEIAERARMQAEIERVHSELLETSRRAGMAEVATNVLHNVGNVLNSVNVSASLVADNTRRSRVPYLARTVELLNQHAADLPAFLTNDPRGRQVPDYLKQLSIALVNEQQGAIKELDLLRKNIEHIKDIVSVQQTYAKTSGVTEMVSLAALAEDAIRVNASLLSRPDIRLEREFADVPPMALQKHKVLQILINLVGNARHACDESGKADKWIKIRVSKVGEDAQVAVQDNGVGIAPENLNRIFNHGFTTRKGGHGFGLHSGALAARELGGSLQVHSDGPGQGATFTLKLPLLPAKPGA
jgi:signal transduction histidine kinase/streptogramin lyase